MFDDEGQPLFIGQDLLILDFKVKSCPGHDEHLGIFADCLADDFFQAADPEGVIGGCGTHSEIGEYHIHILFNPEHLHFHASGKFLCFRAFLYFFQFFPALDQDTECCNWSLDLMNPHAVIIRQLLFFNLHRGFQLFFLFVKLPDQFLVHFAFPAFCLRKSSCLCPDFSLIFFQYSLSFFISYENKCKPDHIP